MLFKTVTSRRIAAEPTKGKLFDKEYLMNVN